MSLLLAAGATLVATPASSAPTQAPHSTQAGAPAALTADQALYQARKSDKDVEATAATTIDSTLTAHPDGTFTLSQSLAPARKRVNGTWKNLDATLLRNGDGTITTATTSSDLTLSGGGTGPLATMDSAGRTLAISMPMRLPEPTLSGATATYREVLNGVDLTVTADKQGGFSEVLIVKNARAAANPALKRLTLATRTRGVTVSADGAGNIKAADRAGHPVFTATAPRMWDSSGATSAAMSADGVTNPTTGQLVDRRTGQPLRSSAQGPGKAARSASLAARAGAAGITLTPAADVLRGPGTVYPVYIDPTFVAPSAGSSLQAWTYTSSYYPSASFWKNSGDLRVGYTDDPNYPPTYTARSYLQISVPSAIYGSTIISSQLNITEDWAWSCTPESVELWTAAFGISSSTDWSNQPAPSALVDYQTVAHGWSSACPTAGVGFAINSPMQTAANSGTARSLTFVLKAGSESNDLYWKKFDPSTVKVSTTFDHRPNRPTLLTTSPSTSCSDNTTVGDGSVTLYAGVSDPDGGTVGSDFQLLPHGATSPVIAESASNSLTNNSGSTSVFVIPRSTLESAANGNVTEFDWRVEVSDFKYWGDWSPTCRFSFDPTRTGPPNIAPVPDQTTTIGTPFSVTINKPDKGTIPSSYEYQLNGGAPLNVKADSTGKATVTVTPRRNTNVLTVSSLSLGANYGDSASIHFNSQAPTTPQAEGDLSGDGIPDLVTTGGQDNLPSGLWLSDAKADPGKTVGNGHVNPAAADIGRNGAGINAGGQTGAGSPSDFNGAQVVTGHFTGSALQDVLAYYPGGNNAGGAEILNGNGDGSALDTQYSENTHNVDNTILLDNSGNTPLEVVNAGNTSGTHDPTNLFPDLLGIGGNTLTLYPSLSQTAAWDWPTTLTTTSPDGTPDWNSWTLATTQTTTGTAMFLWNKSTGQLDLWENLTSASGPLTYTDYPIATGFNTGAAITLQAADINRDGTPDLWTVSSNGTVTTHVFTNLSTSTAATDTQFTDALTTPSHTWPLNDVDTGSIATAADTTGTLSATGSGGATWATGDLFSPAAHVDGSGVITAGGSAVTTSSDFTVSAWVKPSALGGYVMGQKGTHTSGFALFSDSATQSWRFEMPRSDADNPTEDVAAATTVPAQAGAWVRLTGTYTASTGRMVLYIDDVAAAQATHATSTAWNATGALTAGAYWYNDSITGHFVGDIADVQTFPKALTAKQVAILAGNPGPTSYAHINDNHDFNGDGTADVIGVRADGTLHFYAGAAESNLVDGGQLWDSTWSGVRLMTSGNFTGNHDTDADIVAIWADGTAHFYTNDGTVPVHLSSAGQLAGGTTWNTVVQIAAADFTGDGHTDLLAIWGDGTVHIYPGDGNGTIGSAGPDIWPDTSWKTMKLLGAGDYNNDGHADLLGEWADGSLHLYTGDGNGHLTQGVQMIGGTTWSTVKGIVPGDFTNDGLTDLVAVWGYDGSIRPYAGDGNGNLASAGPNMWPDDTWKSMGLIA